MAKRKGLSKRTRFEVFKRDGFTCHYCGRTPPTVTLQVDHIIAVASGGGDESSNLITACSDCNCGKSDRPLSEVPEAIEVQLAEQVERREQLDAFNRFLMRARKRTDTAAREIGIHWNNYLRPGEPGQWTFGAARLRSVKTFLERLPSADVYDAVDIAMARVKARASYDDNAWKYFCGVCWSKIKQREGKQ